MRAAISADIDVLITGDKKLLASDIVKPRIITPKDFLSM
jgi:predicted nucleic acid-binding protein